MAKPVFTDEDFNKLKDRLIAATGNPGLTSFRDGKVHMDISEWERLIKIAEKLSSLDVKKLTEWMHKRQSFEYDECDHGVYHGGAQAGEPYAMCERWANAFVRENL